MRDINPDDRIVQRLLVTLLSLVVFPTLQRQPLGRAVLCVPLCRLSQWDSLRRTSSAL